MEYKRDKIQRRYLPEDVIKLHLQFRGKRLTGSFGELVKKFRTARAFPDVAKAADKLYGLSEREIAIHLALAYMFESNSHTESFFNTAYASNLVDQTCFWSRSPQGEQFWLRLSRNVS